MADGVSGVDAFEVLIVDGAPGGLPMRLQALLDPERPIERPERFVPAERSTPLVGGMVLLVCGAICVAFVRSAFLMARAEDPPKLVIALGLLAFFAWPAVWGWRQVAAYRAEGREIAAGRSRAGIYVEDDGLLWLGWSGRVTWLPRSRIIGAYHGKVPESGSGGASISSSEVIYRDVAGARASFVLETASSARVAGALSAWLAGEPFRKPQS